MTCSSRREEAYFKTESEEMIRASSRRLLQGVYFVTSLIIASCAIAQSTADAYPSAKSKKGLQVELVNDALALGVKHAAININLSSLVDPKGDTNNPSISLDGCTFHFRRGYVEHMDKQINPLATNGVLVYLIVLAYQSGDADVNRVMLHPRYDPKAPNHLGAFNTVTEEGRAWFRACVEFMAHRWSASRERGQASLVRRTLLSAEVPSRKWRTGVSALRDSPVARVPVIGYIIGNEVNSHWFWSNMGSVTMEEFANDYLRAVRLAHTALRRHSPMARIYISLEHHWNIRYPGGNERQAFPGRPFIDYFARKAKEGGDFDWHLAFHPYPENLFEPRFWNDNSATTNSDTPRITFKNLHMLTDYFRRPELRYQEKPRRIILSEQGFHTPKSADGETIQAAAYCYAYKKVETMDAIDAFILHRHVDNDHEGGLLLGLRRNKPANGDPRPKKLIYECFRLADTPDWDRAFAFALPVIGLQSWDEIAK